MILQKQLTNRVICERDEFSDKHIRSIQCLYSQSLRRGCVGKRPDSYIESIIFLGYGNALIDCRDRVLGFTVVRPLGISEDGDPVLYGESTLWRNGGAHWEDLRALLIDATKRWNGRELYGAYYKSNEGAEHFHALDQGFERVERDSVPIPIRNEVSHYDDIDILRLRVS